MSLVIAGWWRLGAPGDADALEDGDTGAVLARYTRVDGLLQRNISPATYTSTPPATS